MGLASETYRYPILCRRGGFGPSANAEIKADCLPRCPAIRTSYFMGPTKEQIEVWMSRLEDRRDPIGIGDLTRNRGITDPSVTGHEGRVNNSTSAVNATPVMRRNAHRYNRRVRKHCVNTAAMTYISTIRSSIQIAARAGGESPTVPICNSEVFLPSHSQREARGKSRGPKMRVRRTTGVR
jgi:hypothetical protein